MPRPAIFQIPAIDWYDDAQETLRAEIFIWVGGVFLIVIALGSLAAFAI